MMELTASLSNYCIYSYGEDENHKRQFYEVMKSSHKMTIIMLKNIKYTLVNRINKNIFLKLDKQKNCRPFTRQALSTDSNKHCMVRGAIEEKTFRISVLPGFCKIVRGGGNRGAPPCFRAPTGHGRSRQSGGRKYIPKSPDKILEKSWIEFCKGKIYQKISYSKWLVLIVGYNTLQIRHGKLGVSKTCTFRPWMKQFRIQIFDINHKSDVSYSFILEIKEGNFIYLTTIICMVQVINANVGNLNLDLNDAIKKLFGTFRPYSILNTIDKFNVKLYALINFRKNILKHGLNYLSYLLSNSGGFFKSPHILSFNYSQNKSPELYDFMKAREIGHNMKINVNSHNQVTGFKSEKLLTAIICMVKLIKANVGNLNPDLNDAIKKLFGTFRPYSILNIIDKFKVKLYALINIRKNISKHEVNYLLYLFTISGGSFKSPHILSFSYSQNKSLTIKCEIEFADSYILSITNRNNKRLNQHSICKCKKDIVKKIKYDFIGTLHVFHRYNQNPCLRMNIKGLNMFLWPTGWKSVTEYFIITTITVKVNSTYLGNIYSNNNQIRLFNSSYKNICGSCPAKRSNIFLLNKLSTFCTKEPTSSLSTYCMYLCEDVSNIKGKLHGNMKLPNTMPNVVLPNFITGWKSVIEYLIITFMTVKLTSTFLCNIFSKNNKVRLFKCSYKNIGGPGLAKRCKLSTFCTKELTSSLSTYCMYLCEDVSNIKRKLHENMEQLFGARKSTITMSIITLENFKEKLTIGINKDISLDLKNKNLVESSYLLPLSSKYARIMRDLSVRWNTSCICLYGGYAKHMSQLYKTIITINTKLIIMLLKYKITLDSTINPITPSYVLGKLRKPPFYSNSLPKSRLFKRLEQKQKNCMFVTGVKLAAHSAATYTPCLKMLNKKKYLNNGLIKHRIPSWPEGSRDKGSHYKNPLT